MKSVKEFNLQFGLVGIACKLYLAAKSEAVESHLYHTVCKTQVKQGSSPESRYHCPTCAKALTADEYVKGFPVGDQVVTATADDLKSLEAESDKSVQVLTCVPLASVDPRYYEKTYYVGPDKKDKSAVKVYALFAKVLAARNEAAIVKLVRLGKEQVAVVRSVNGRLVLATIYYANEVRNIDEIQTAGAFSEAEEALANQLIESLGTEAFDPTLYTDEYQVRVQAMIAAKQTGETVSAAGPAKQAEVIDLLAALKASLSKKAAA